MPNFLILLTGTYFGYLFYVVLILRIVLIYFHIDGEVRDFILNIIYHHNSLFVRNVSKRSQFES